MTPTKSLLGKRFGRLVPIAYQGRNAYGNSLWLCECDCGNFRQIPYQNLTAGLSKSCGCGHRLRARRPKKLPSTAKLTTPDSSWL